MKRRRLDAELVRRHLAESRTAAQRAIADSLVELDGVIASKPATLVSPDAGIRLVGEPARFVSRAGEKLRHALDVFPVDVADSRAVDVGASTGGFTDCLLQMGAVSVCALEFGYRQIHWRLRNDERVSVVERTNIRHADPEELGAPFDVVVADLSFISLRTVASQLRKLGSDSADWVLLVKPQFEVGREQVGGGGIVRDPRLWSQAVSTVNEALAEHGLILHGVDVSPVVGTKGNREFVVWYRTEQPAHDTTGRVAEAVRRAEAAVDAARNDE